MPSRRIAMAPKSAMTILFVNLAAKIGRVLSSTFTARSSSSITGSRPKTRVSLFYDLLTWSRSQLKEEEWLKRMALAQI